MLLCRTILFIDDSLLLATLHANRPKTALTLVFNHHEAKLFFTDLAALGESPGVVDEEGLENLMIFILPVHMIYMIDQIEYHAGRQINPLI